MPAYKLYTSANERNALPRCLYVVHGVNSEAEAINRLYESVKSGLRPASELRRYSIPDYTCGFEIQPQTRS